LKPSDRKLNLTSYDEIFQTEETRIEATQEKVIDIPLTDLHPFKNHPFKVTDDESMLETVESITKHGVLVPVIARPREEGGYELISGHRRKRASELAGKETLPCSVRNLDDDAATIIMVDSNIQRENILPSERAFAYKLKLEAIKHQGQRNDLTSGQVGQKSKYSIEKIADQTGESYKQVQRFIRLTELVPELLDMVDTKKIAFNPAVELSYLIPHEQVQLMEAMDMEQATPSLSQAQRLKKYSQDGKLTFDVMTAIMSEDKKGELDKVTLTGEKLKKYFPKSYTPQQMEETIIKLLEGWSRKRQQSQER
jgi:ParB family chromosome partitioning protein